MDDRKEGYKGKRTNRYTDERNQSSEEEKI